MFLITGIIIAALFLVSTSMPLLSWALPFYKIKKLENADFKTKAIANLVAIVAIGWIDINFLFPYLGIYITIEVLYILFDKYGRKIEMYDRIFIISLIVGVLISGYLFFNKIGLNLSLENLKEIYVQKTEFSQREINLAFDFIRKNTLLLIFIYTNFTVFLTYYFLKKDSFLKWKVSYLWLVPYIVLFFVEKYSGINSMYISNGVSIFKIVYALYFIKIITGLLNRRVKKQPICFIIAVIMTVLSPEFAFIFGALASGINIKVKVIK
ncbi:hypothetical protein [uncultured Cetobacterium sp.]|uniref:hypothetical protein n=1 Tax=uncultured Cetobacterium sp. TaxID=527638 RepID=UPI00260F5911|nr:hypothetical protein [uncultured Cetobacterium sp.]